MTATLATLASTNQYPYPHPAFAPPVNLSGRGHYLHWGFVQVSAANIVMIALIGVAFLVALFVPFPKPFPKPKSKGRDGK